VCGGQSPSGFLQNPGGSVTFPSPASNCKILLKDLRGPDPTTTEPPLDTCPEGPDTVRINYPKSDPRWAYLYAPPNYNTGAREGPCYDEALDGPPIGSGVVPFGLLGATGLTLYALGSPNRRRRWGRSG
jgi:hypothetical protein